MATMNLRKLKVVPHPAAESHVPIKPTLPRLRGEAAVCRACDLWKRGRQTVFGEGARSARLVLVGEQPGNEEDLAGHPFVGPAGRLLDQALVQAGIDRREAYVTNVVKHFKWEPRGKRRIHSKPNWTEINACMPWLMAELDVIKPACLVCLGATAAQAIFGRAFRVTTQRGTFVPSSLAPHVMATVHPSSILRAPSDDERHKQMHEFVGDLAKVGRLLSEI
jgi:DNA polymerase